MKEQEKKHSYSFEKLEDEDKATVEAIVTFLSGTNTAKAMRLLMTASDEVCFQSSVS